MDKKVLIKLAIVAVFVVILVCIYYGVTKSKNDLSETLSIADELYKANVKIDELESKVEELENSVIPTTFYATIEKVNKESKALLVKGLDVNDINSRGKFEVILTDDTKIIWRNQEIKFDDLKEEQNVSISYYGGVWETEPAQIPMTVQIQVLNDNL